MSDLLTLVAIPLIHPKLSPKAKHGTSEGPVCLSITTLILNPLRFTLQQTFVKKLKNKDQLDVTCYFISLLMCSTCFGHHYIHHQELATILLNYHIGRIVLGSMCVGVSVWLGWSGIRVAG